MLEQLLQAISDFQAKAKEEGTTVSEADAAKVAKALKEGATQPIYQHVHDAGFDGAYGRKSERERALEADLEEARTRAEKAERRAKRLETEQPDVAALEEKYTTELTALQQQLKDAEERHAANLDDLERQRALDTLERRLVDKGVHPRLAKAEARDQAARLKVVRGEGGQRSVQVLKQAGGMQTLQAEDPLDALAAEVRETVPPDLIVAHADAGSGHRDSDGGAGGGGGNVWDKVRQQAQQDRERQGKGDAPSGAARLRGERVSAGSK